MGLRDLTSTTLPNGTAVSVASVKTPDGWQLVSFTTNAGNVLSQVIDESVYFHFTNVELLTLHTGKLLVAYSAYDVDPNTDQATSVLRSSVSTDGVSWQPPTSILPQRVESALAEPVKSFGGFQQVRLTEDAKGKLGAVVITKADTNVATKPTIQLVTSNDGRSWAKAGTIGTASNKPSRFEPTTVVANPNQVTVFWQSHSDTGVRQLFYSTSANLAKPIWSAPVSVAPKTATPLGFEVASSSNGNIAVTFDDGDPANFYLSRFNATSKKWLVAKQLDLPLFTRVRSKVSINNKFEVAIAEIATDGNQTTNIIGVQISPVGVVSPVTTFASDIVIGNEVFFVHLDDFATWNVLFDQEAEVAIDVNDEVMLDTTLQEVHGDLNNLSAVNSLTTGDKFVESISLTYDKQANPTLAYYQYDADASELGIAKLNQTRAPSFNSAAALKSPKTVAKGSLLSVTVPAVSGNPVPLVSISWYACTSAHTAGTAIAKDCKAIAGATTSSFKVTAAQKAKYVLAAVKAINPLGVALQTTATSAKSK